MGKWTPRVNDSRDGSLSVLAGHGEAARCRVAITAAPQDLEMAPELTIGDGIMVSCEEENMVGVRH